MGLARAPVCHLLGGYASTISSHAHGYATSFERMLVLCLRQELIFLVFFPSPPVPCAYEHIADAVLQVRTRG